MTVGASPGRGADPGGADGRCAWFHCFSGIAGDMALAALVDAGADLEAVLESVRRLGVGGWHVERRSVRRGGIACTRLEVTVEDDATSRTHRDLAAEVARAGLHPRVEQRALAVFDRLARAEARVHGVAVPEVHFHEVGGHDALIDVVGTASALEVLGIDEVRCSTVAVGSGMTESSHGKLPDPAPAVLGLLAGMPVRGLEVGHELTTPTGAALLAALSTGHGALPAMELRATGYGAGSRDLAEMPNCTQVVIGELVEEPAPAAGQPLTLLAANVDDATGEQLAAAVEELLAAGALDAWLAPVVMKKGRPGAVVQALCDPALAPRLRSVLRQATGSFGVRALPVERWAAARREGQVEVDGMAIRIKASAERAKPELEDARRVAAASGRPLAEVQALALAAWRREEGP